MGAKNSKKNDFEIKSISSVYEHSITSDSNKINLSPKRTKREDIINELKQEVILPIENESSESSEILFEQNVQSKIKNYFENDDINNDIYNEENNDCLNKFFPEDDLFHKKRSKTFVPNPSILDTPRLPSKVSENNYFISPFKLSIKSFGILPKKNQKPNKILSDFHKEIMDCKSCNDNEEDIFDDYLLFNAETEKTTPNPEDLDNLVNFRKTMIKFRNSVNLEHCHEYENILNCDKILEDIQNENQTHHKRKSMYNKFIKAQLDEEKNKNYEHKIRLHSQPIVGFDINCDNSEDKKEDEKEKDKNNKGDENDLFILGIIERAAKHKKRNKSLVVK